MTDNINDVMERLFLYTDGHDVPAVKVLTSDLKALLSCTKQCREALEPFAEFSEDMDTRPDGYPWRDDQHVLRGLSAGAFRAARQALSTQPGGKRMKEWQPIETAPTDNSRILVWVTGRMMPGARFGSAYRQVDGRVIAKPEGGNGDWTQDITHWMPPPEGPE